MVQDPAGSKQPTRVGERFGELRTQNTQNKQRLALPYYCNEENEDTFLDTAEFISPWRGNDMQGYGKSVTLTAPAWVENAKKILKSLKHKDCPNHHGQNRTVPEPEISLEKAKDISVNALVAYSVVEAFKQWIASKEGEKAMPGSNICNVFRVVDQIVETTNWLKDDSASQNKKAKSLTDLAKEMQQDWVN
jgi:hypothetical protein